MRHVITVAPVEAGWVMKSGEYATLLFATRAQAIWSARIAHARRMLTSKFDRHLLVAEIAFRSGFSDHSTFDRMFRRAYGITPGEMRRISLESS